MASYYFSDFGEEVEFDEIIVLNDTLYLYLCDYEVYHQDIINVPNGLLEKLEKLL